MKVINKTYKNLNIVKWLNFFRIINIAVNLGFFVIGKWGLGLAYGIILVCTYSIINKQFSLKKKYEEKNNIIKQETKPLNKKKLKNNKMKFVKKA